MAVDLQFNSPASGDLNLVFGLSEGPDPTHADATIAGAFPGLAAAISVVPNTRATISGSFAGLSCSASAVYASNAARPTVGQSSATWQSAAGVQTGPQHDQQSPRPVPAGWDTFWQRTLSLPAGVDHLLPDVLAPARTAVACAHHGAAEISAGTSSASQDAARVPRYATSAFENALNAVKSAARFRHQDGDRTIRALYVSDWGEGLRAIGWRWSAFQPARHQREGWDGRYQEAVPPPAGITIRPPAPSGREPCYTPDPNLLFGEQFGATTDLVFICDNYVAPPEATVVVPVRRVYIVLNSASLVRISDSQPIPTLSLSLSLDADSWTWGFNASLPASAQALVEPGDGPVELLASVNGVSFRLLAESLSRERTFGQASIRVSGRGRNAILDAPYAPTMTFQNSSMRTAAQLAGDALTFNGVPLGWAVEWGLTDWSVPAGAFTHLGTHISALNAIAQAAGGYVQPHPTSQSLIILPRYPSAPWSWSGVTPDFELPSAVTTRESIQWVDKPVYNRVFVSGESVGVLGQITRAGTAGDVAAQMVTDPLITHVDAARQRGLAVLADTGRIATVGLSLPVLESTGVITPGNFVRYVDGGVSRIGIVRSTAVSVGESAREVSQQIVLETHE